MQTNPFKESVINRVTGISAVTVTWAIFAILLYFYIESDWEVVCLDSLISIGLLAIAGYLYGYIGGNIAALYVKVLLLLMIQAVNLAGVFGLKTLLADEPFGVFVLSIPLRLIFGMFCWIILLQWLQVNRIEISAIDEIAEPEEVNGEETPESAETILDRVSVKDGTRIHIIHLEELLYLQAGGDYVTFFTPTGQYVKEQTMKYFELHLPSHLFVRIHRSCIVNTEQILRVELFGKENYQIRLKNGVCLKASNAGYKLLKERLML